MGVNYRKFYERCRKRYPHVVLDLVPQKKMEKTPAQIVDAYFRITGKTTKEIKDNHNQEFVIFVAAVVKASDGDYYSFGDRPPKGLIKETEKITGFNNRKILYFLKKSQIFWSAYPDFRKQVNEICRKIEQDELIPDKSQQQKPALHND